MRNQAEDGQFTYDEDLRDDFLIFAPLKVRTGVNRVFPRPASRRKQRIQTIDIGTLIDVRDDLTCLWWTTFRGVRKCCSGR